MGRKAVLSGLLAVACLAGIGCGGNSNPIPVIDSVSPVSVPAGEGAFAFSISGTNMNNSSSVTFGSNSLTVLNVQTPPCPTQMNCPVILVVLVPASQVSAAGAQQVSVTTDGKRSKSLTFNVTSPQILTMSPSAVPAGAAAFPLTMTVLGAAPTIQVGFGTAKNPNTPLTPTGPISCNPQTACTVVVTVPAASVKNAGAMQVTAINPLASSGGTATANFLVTTPGTGFPIPQSASGGTPGNAASTHSSVSDGGLFVAFDSTATNLSSTAGNGLSQVYLRQNCFGMASCTPQTTMISTAGGAAGAGGVNGSDRPQISADGRFVVFESDDTNLAASVTTPVEQIYLYDSCNSISGAVKGCTAKLTLISSNGMTPGDAPSLAPTISAYGLYVAFQSSATNLTAGNPPANVNQIYLFQNCNGVTGAISGCAQGTTLLSTDINGNPGDADSVTPSIDPLGVAVAFESLANNIASGTPSNGARQIYLRTTCLETAPLLASPCTQQTVLLSADSSGKPGASDSITPTLTDNGTLFAAFASAAPNLLPANVTAQQIFGVQACVTLPTTVKCAPGTRVLSVNSAGLPGQAASSNPSASGSNVVFTSLATLLSGISGQQVFGVPACAPGPCSATPVLISADANGTGIGGDFGAVGGGGLAAFSTVGSSGAPGIGEIFLAAPF
ncbi:MAG TPA: hypothetical protein VKB26_11305 [Candidatus Acidoferrales bacterium]|nr:hypothetical protein [Candidatus Acidoferrales bacterium]